jgi:hypothetical protein
MARLSCKPSASASCWRASPKEASATLTLASCSGISSGLGWRSNLVSCAWDMCSDARRWVSSACKARSSSVKSASPALTVSPTLTNSSVTTPDTGVPTAMLCVLASMMPEPAT